MLAPLTLEYYFGMSALPRDLLVLAGQALAHAAWSISDDPSLLVPMALVSGPEGVQLMRFEGEDARQVVERAIEQLEGGTYPHWALAFEVRMGGDSGAIQVQGKSKDYASQLDLIQPCQYYKPKSGFFRKEQPFLLLEPFWMMIDRVGTDDPVLREAVMQGVQWHPQAAPLWSTWSA